MANAIQKKRWKRKASELVAEDIANHILVEAISEGTMLLSEKEMIESYNVGRNTIREALRLLEARGVITIKTGPNGGPVVRRPRHDDLSEALSLILQFANASLADILNARAQLEPLLTRIAAKIITKKQISELEETIKVMQNNICDQSMFLVENRKFHNIIADAADNIVLKVFVDTLVALAGGGVVNFRYTENRCKAIIEAHQKIIDSFKDNDVDAAATNMQVHLDDAGTFWRKKYNEQYTAPVKWLQL